MTRLWQIIVCSLRGLALTIVLGLSLLLFLIIWTMHAQGIRLFGVETGSMVPAIRIGDAVAVRSIPFKQLTAGQVVSYQSDSGAIISHRIRSINRLSRTVIVQGDSNLYPDTVVQSSQIVGQVQHILPGFGQAATKIHNPVVLVATVYVPATIWLVWQVRQLEQQLRGSYRVRRGRTIRV